jgi:ribosomal protein S27AE
MHSPVCPSCGNGTFKTKVTIQYAVRVDGDRNILDNQWPDQSAKPQYDTLECERCGAEIESFSCLRDDAEIADAMAKGE